MLESTSESVLPSSRRQASTLSEDKLTELGYTTTDVDNNPIGRDGPSMDSWKNLRDENCPYRELIRLLAGCGGFRIRRK